eukprot:624082-Hanusia_phi.AAC.8
MFHNILPPPSPSTHRNTVGVGVEKTPVHNEQSGKVPVYYRLFMGVLRIKDGYFKENFPNRCPLGWGDRSSSICGVGCPFLRRSTRFI